MKITVQTVFSVALSVIFSAVMLAVSPVAFGQESPTEVQAPFGLKWGAKQKSFSKLYDCKPDGQFTYCRTKSVPKGLSNAEVYALNFHAKEGLQKVSYFSEVITGDTYGTEGKERVEHLRAALSRKYPKAKTQNLSLMHMRLYKDPHEFYECLRHPGCGLYAVTVEPGKGDIGILIKGVSRGKGFIVLSYESPKWLGLLDSKKKAEKAQDEDAL